MLRGNVRRTAACFSGRFCRMLWQNDSDMTRLFALFALSATLAAALPARAEIPAPIQERLRAAGLPADSLAFVVQRSDGRTLAGHSADAPMQPASTLKLLTSLVALETLAPSWRGRSELLAAGRIDDGVLHGDLVLRGAGDVDLDAEAFEALLRMARVKGVRDVRGDLVLDRTVFEPPRMDVGVPPFDETPAFRYNVIPDAISLNTNLLRVTMASDARSVRAAFAPALEGVRVVPALTLVDASCDDWEDDGLAFEVRRLPRGALEVRLSGDFPRDCAATSSINVIDRVEFAERLFRATWARLGGRFRGHAREAAAPAGAKLLASHRSRALSEIVHDIDKRSDNPNARLVYLALGTQGGATGEPTLLRSERVVRDWLRGKGIDARGLVLENGSGLSRRERIAPATLAAVLRAGLSSPWAPEFIASLPIAAVDGSMRKRLNGTAAAASARLKTGTLRDTSAVAGYLRDASGATLVIAAMINDPAARKEIARPILDALVEWALATGSAGIPP
jgi:D-alanyl-D-alanine carboxypeptidase/D-alanyl-D-alanine-endopeptidase (penicillin-binding protein 4)